MKFLFEKVKPRLCPHCAQELEKIKMRGIEIDRCRECGGRWFDKYEIEAFLRTKRDLTDYVPAHKRRWLVGHLPCPVCRERMDQLVANDIFSFRN